MSETPEQYEEAMQLLTDLTINSIVNHQEIVGEEHEHYKVLGALATSLENKEFLLTSVHDLSALVYNNQQLSILLQKAYEALKFYADPTSWAHPSGLILPGQPLQAPATTDHGQQAKSVVDLLDQSTRPVNIKGGSP